MSTVQKSVEVNVPVRVAYNQWTQFESFPEFMDGVESITQTDDTHSHWVVKVGGVKREYDTEILEQTPDQLVSWRSTGGDTGGNSGRVTFESLGETATRVNIELGWEPEGLVEKAGAAVGVDDHQIKADLKRFKEFIEQRGAETGAWRGDISN
jgi:uncharacterized membrane protein